MSINLSNLTSVQSNLFVRIDVQEYASSPSVFTPQVLRFTDRIGSFTLNGEQYIGLGNLLDVSVVNSELRVSGNETTVNVSGIPNSSLIEILNSKIKGSNIRIYRGLFDAVTGNFLNISGNPVGRFQGIVSNLSLSEDFDVESRTSSNILIFSCSSVIDVLGNKLSGRKTNPASQNKFFPNDRGMNRVPVIENSYFDFGVQK